MKGDFTRETFDKKKHFSRVLMQQGRVQLDADWNEQVAVLLHYLRTLAADLIGPHGGPIDEHGFGIFNKVGEKGEQDCNKPNSHVLCLEEGTFQELTISKKLPLKEGDFLVSKGRYYVDGLLCENDDYILFTNQPDWTPEAIDEYPCLIYLDVWERLITYIQDDEIREVALNGLDTTVRSRVVWQVKTTKEGIDTDSTCDNLDWGNLVKNWQPENRGRLKVQARASEASDDLNPCTISPDSHYRGAENQLYRVEIHRSTDPPTFKWSRENGSVTFPIQAISDKIVTVEHLGQDGRFSLKKNDWVEIVDDDTVLHGLAESLYQVDDVNVMTREITLKTKPTTVRDNETKHPLLRRWDHREGNAEKGGLTLDHQGAALIDESNNKWLKLEDGIEIQFQADGTSDGTYRTGDYWLIPARTATGDVQWPDDENGTPPHGVEHHYAPLAILKNVNGGKVEDCRQKFVPLAGKLMDALLVADNPTADNPFVTQSALPRPQLTPAQANAIKEATRASGKNPFVTKADLESN